MSKNGSDLKAQTNAISSVDEDPFLRLIAVQKFENPFHGHEIIFVLAVRGDVKETLTSNERQCIYYWVRRQDAAFPQNSHFSRTSFLWVFDFEHVACG